MPFRIRISPASTRGAGSSDVCGGTGQLVDPIEIAPQSVDPRLDVAGFVDLVLPDKCLLQVVQNHQIRVGCRGQLEKPLGILERTVAERHLPGEPRDLDVTRIVVLEKRNDRLAFREAVELQDSERHSPSRASRSRP